MLLNQQLQESKVLYGSTSKRLKSDKVLDVLQENRINMAVFFLFSANNFQYNLYNTGFLCLHHKLLDYDEVRLYITMLDFDFASYCISHGIEHMLIIGCS
ncbi:hypothetical protein ES288_D10G280100v1 [Gossypium darwinii]|uniref:Uncharacterized protein n=1 Tax=Gossypium darwinii TaxID=34276 RepID=A0A5D2B324_GOSDA|nr:hypothetical protein ES288_D10G280100v1 [Gossypium darwinii]